MRFSPDRIFSLNRNLILSDTRIGDLNNPKISPDENCIHLNHLNIRLFKNASNHIISIHPRFERNSGSEFSGSALDPMSCGHVHVLSTTRRMQSEENGGHLTPKYVNILTTKVTISIPRRPRVHPAP